MTQDNGMDQEDLISGPYAGALARIFARIASCISNRENDEAYQTAMICARQFAAIAADKGGEWKPLSDKEHLERLEAARARQRETQERWAARNGISADGCPVAHFRGREL